MKKKTGAWAPSAIVGGLATAPVIAILLARQTMHDPTALTWLTAVAVGSALVLGAALANLARVVLAVEELWVVVVVLSALGAKALVPIGVSVPGAGDRPSETWMLLSDLGLLALLLALIPLTASRQRRLPPLTCGAVLGVAFATVLAAPPVDLAGSSTLTLLLLGVAILAGYGWAAVMVSHHWPWGRTSNLGVTSALVTLGAAQALHAQAGAAAWAGLVGAGADLLAAILLATTLWAVVTEHLFAERRRSTALRERLREEEEAYRRERRSRHALRNMVAGISMASELLEDDDLEEPIRRRLEHTIHVEAVQLRLLLDQNQDPSQDPAQAVEQHDSPSIPELAS